MIGARFGRVTARGHRRGPYRKRSLEDKRAIVRECLIPGASVAAVALAHRVNANLLRKWLKKYRAGEYGEIQSAVGLLPVKLTEAADMSAASPAAPTMAGHIEIELAAGRVRVHGTVDAHLLRAVLASLLR